MLYEHRMSETQLDEPKCLLPYTVKRKGKIPWITHNIDKIRKWIKHCGNGN